MRLQNGAERGWCHSLLSVTSGGHVRSAVRLDQGGACVTRSDQFTVGVDFGTLSGRAVVVRVSDGAEVGTAVHDYAHGVLDSRLAAGAVPLPPDWALQVPSDYVDVLATAVPEAVRAAGIDPSQV